MKGMVLIDVCRKNYNNPASYFLNQRICMCSPIANFPILTLLKLVQLGGKKSPSQTTSSRSNLSVTQSNGKPAGMELSDLEKV